MWDPDNIFHHCHSVGSTSQNCCPYWFLILVSAIGFPFWFSILISRMICCVVVFASPFIMVTNLPPLTELCALFRLTKIFTQKMHKPMQRQTKARGLSWLTQFTHSLISITMFALTSRVILSFPPQRAKFVSWSGIWMKSRTKKIPCNITMYNKDID